MGINIKCLFGNHDWKFSYHHSMPLGISLDKSLRMFDGGKTFAVDVCTRCKVQSRFVKGYRVILKQDEMQSP